MQKWQRRAASLPVQTLASSSQLEEPETAGMGGRRVNLVAPILLPATGIDMDFVRESIRNRMQAIQNTEETHEGPLLPGDPQRHYIADVEQWILAADVSPLGLTGCFPLGLGLHVSHTNRIALEQLCQPLTGIHPTQADIDGESVSSTAKCSGQWCSCSISRNGSCGLASFATVVCRGQAAHEAVSKLAAQARRIAIAHVILQWSVYRNRSEAAGVAAINAYIVNMCRSDTWVSIDRELRALADVHRVGVAVYYAQSRQWFLVCNHRVECMRLQKRLWWCVLLYDNTHFEPVYYLQHPSSASAPACASSSSSSSSYSSASSSSSHFSSQWWFSWTEWRHHIKTSIEFQEMAAHWLQRQQAWR